MQTSILKGDTFDVAILISTNMEAVAKEGHIDNNTRINFARSGLGVAVRSGEPKPDISTVDAFRRTLIKAKSIAYVTAGASGRHFMSVCDRLGIAEEVRSKSKTLPTGSVVEFVVNREAELAIQQISEVLSVKGIDLVGPFPPELDLVSQIVVAISAKSKQPEAANAFLKYLANPHVIELIQAKGLAPG